MQKGLKTRIIIHEILYLIKYNNYNLDDLFKKKFSEKSIIKSDKKLIQNVVLTSMRFQFYINKIIKKYSDKKVNKHQYLILLSALTQLIYLNFKEYAVIYCSVEIAKIKKYEAVPKFINAILRNTLRNKNNLLNIKISSKDIPNWINKEINFLSENEKNNLLKTVTLKPNLHCVFKKKIHKDFFNLNILKTSSKSVVVNNIDDIESLPGYKNGEWWVQDYSVMLPISLTKNIKNKITLDMCAAPGGKSFQLISEGAKLDIIEKNNYRALRLQENLDRLNYKNKIIIADALNLNENKKYDLIIIDAPCSSLGTIRRNPEIFFRNKLINFNKYTELQNKLLTKASKIINKHGIIIYMVCSFAKKETIDRVNLFLRNNQNFSVQKFQNNIKIIDLIDKNGFLNILPSEYNKNLIDGFFAAKFIKND